MINHIEAAQFLHHIARDLYGITCFLVFELKRPRFYRYL